MDTSEMRAVEDSKSELPPQSRKEYKMTEAMNVQMQTHQESKVGSPLRMSQAEGNGNPRNNSQKWFLLMKEYKRMEENHTLQRHASQASKSDSQIRMSRPTGSCID
jgi:hypothetical protein